MSDTNLSDPPVDETQIAGDQPSDPPSTPAEAPSEPAPRVVPMETFTREVLALRQKNRDNEAALEEHRRQLSEARQLIERFQNPGNGAERPASPAPSPRPAEPSYSQQEIDRRAAELNFQRDATAVSEAGVKAYGQRWADSINILGSFNLNSADFVQSIMDIAGRDKAHEIVHEIASNPETAAALSNMSPNRRIAEIARMSSKPATSAPPAAPAPATPPAKNVSKAPAPAPRVEPSAGKIQDWRNPGSEDSAENNATFSRGFDEKYLRRGDAIRR